jgi:arylsulfatase A-like enzyme
MSQLSRRDFLKLTAASATALGLAGSRSLADALPAPGSGKPNVLILLFDAMSVQNLSVYGYARPTTPNLERFAQRATVYHSHFSGGNFTSPGTASMLTGLYPWHHRALSDRSLVRRDLAKRSFFHHAGSDYTRVGFSQNLWADLFLRQFNADLAEHIPSNSFSYRNLASMVSQDLPKDPLISYFAIDEFLASSHNVFSFSYPGSALWGFFGIPDGTIITPEQAAEYPYGMPSNGYGVYRHPELFAGLHSTFSRLSAQASPWFGYFHIYSPHPPYAPRKEFIGILPAIELPFKKQHPLASNHASWKQILEYRNRYDEYIKDLDAEFGKLMDRLEAEGILDSTYVIITSDHGELFERGEYGHGSPLMYDAVIHIPLLVSAPGQRQHNDVYTATSNTDILPTIAHLSGNPIPTDIDGRLLPGLGGSEETDRSVFSIVSRTSSAFQPLKVGTVAMMKEQWKLIHYFGYDNFDTKFELYDLQGDPYEKRDLYSQSPAVLTQLEQELLDTLEDANRPYRKQGT